MSVEDCTGSNHVFSFTGSIQYFDVPLSGMYHLKMWRAGDGSSVHGHASVLSATGGTGGFTQGSFIATVCERLHVVVGGGGGGGKAPYARVVGGSAETAAGGYGGGGYATGSNRTMPLRVTGGRTPSSRLCAISLTPVTVAGEERVTLQYRWSRRQSWNGRD